MEGAGVVEVEAGEGMMTYPMFFQMAIASLIGLWTAGSAAEAAVECHAYPVALGAGYQFVHLVPANGDDPTIATNADQWAATIEAPAEPSPLLAGWVSPWLVQIMPSSKAKAEQWAPKLDAQAENSPGWAGWATPWLIQVTGIGVTANIGLHKLNIAWPLGNHSVEVRSPNMACAKLTS